MRMHVSDSVRDKKEPQFAWQAQWQTSWETCLLGSSDCVATKNLNHGGGRKSESENARLSSGGNLSATQLSEQRARRTINSDNWRKTENSSIQHAESLQDAAEFWPWMLRYAGFLCHEIRTWSGWYRTVQSSV